MVAKLLVIGVDAATWTVIRPNLSKLENFNNLVKTGKSKVLDIGQKPWSPSSWCSMFSGKAEEEHGHRDFVKDGEVQSRENIKVDFVWDVLDKKGYRAKALNVPFVVPPYNFRVSFQAPGNGVPTSLEEMEAEIAEVGRKSAEILGNEELDLFVACFVSIDKLQHLHWGEDIVLDFYRKVDDAIGKMLPHAGKVILVSDHGFCSFGEAPVQTLPKITKDGKEIKGDHHPDAVLITKGVSYEISGVRDVYHCILKELGADSV